MLEGGYLKDKRQKAPGRLIFYRGMCLSFMFENHILTVVHEDGISEAQFQHVLDGGM